MIHKYRVSKYGQVYHECNSQGCDDCTDYWYGCGRHKIYKRYKFTFSKLISMLLNVGVDLNGSYIKERKHSFLVTIDEEGYAFIDYLIAHKWKDVPMRVWKKEVAREREECQEEGIYRYFENKVV